MGCGGTDCKVSVLFCDVCGVFVDVSFSETLFQGLWAQRLEDFEMTCGLFP